MSELFYGSIDITKLLDELKKRHSSFVKASNGKIYCNINMWKNDIPDRYGNLLSIMLSSVKERRDAEGKVYIGNCKESEFTRPKPLDNSDIDSVNSILNEESYGRPSNARIGEHGDSDDLPF